MVVISTNESQSKIKLKFVFYIEGLINFVTLFLCIIFPAIFISQLIDISVTPVALELVRWYGVLLFVITFIMIGILIIENSKAFSIVMLGYLIGDFAQIGIAIYFAVSLNAWSTGIIVTLAITAVLIVFRLIVLIKPKLLGFRVVEKKD